MSNMNKMSQTRIVLSYLNAGYGLTSYQAFKMFGITRLSRVVHELRRAGHGIKTVDMVGANNKRWAKYYMEK